MDSNLVFRTVCVDHDVDVALKEQAAREDVGKGEMCRRYVQAGLQRIVGERLSVPPPDQERLSMRTVYLPVSLDDDLRGTAWNLKTTQTQLMRRALRLGMEEMQRRSLADSILAVSRVGRDGDFARASGAPRAKTRRTSSQRR